MIYICGNNSFEIYKIDTESAQESLKETYCYDSHILKYYYDFTENSKFSLIEHEGWLETFIDGKPAEKFYKIKRLMENIPKDRYICKWCWHCECNEEATEAAICSLDIGDSVNVNDGCCDEFEYDPDFVRY